MKIYFFTKGDKTVASSRYRAYYVAEELNKLGFETEVYSTEGDKNLSQKNKSIYIKIFQRIKEFAKNINILLKLKKNDFVFAQRTVYQIEFVLLLLIIGFFKKAKIIFDFDDSIFIGHPIATKLLTKYSHSVIVGGHFLYDYACKYNKNTFLMPTSVRVMSDYTISDFNPQYKEKWNKKIDSEVNIGWIGRSEAHYHNLKILVPVFQKLSLTHKFSFICAGVSDEIILKKIFSLDNNNINVVLIKKEEINWADEKQIVNLIKNFDVGLMPLVLDDSTKGKCAFKAIQYMAIGIPVVASPVGEINYLINDGINGFMANSCDEWVEKLSYLIDNKSAREKIGREGRKTIEEKYSLEKNIDVVVRIITSKQ